MSHFQKPVPGTAVVSRFSPVADIPNVAAVTFGATGGRNQCGFSMQWFRSEDEASLWLDSTGVPYEILGFEIDLDRLNTTGEVAPFRRSTNPTAPSPAHSMHFNCGKWK